MRCEMTLILMLFSVGCSEQVDEQDDDALTLLQTKLVKEHVDMNRTTGVDGNLANFCSNLNWGDNCRCHHCEASCLGDTAKRLAGCSGNSAPAGRTMQQGCDAFNSWGDECRCWFCSAGCLGNRAKELAQCSSLPSLPVAPLDSCTPAIPALRNTPDTMRQASTIFDGNSMGTGHGRGRLDSSQGWSAQNNRIGEWYQIDNGVVGGITGVAIKGRKDQSQWVQTFKVQSQGVSGTWTDVDGGKVYAGNSDRDTQVNVAFDAPVDARYIRIYPQSWYGHMSMRADIVAGETVTGKTPLVKPNCAGAVCSNAAWLCPSPPPTLPPTPPPSTGPDDTISPGTDSPGGDTEVTDVDCLDAEHGFGPGFTCASTEMYCSTDSGDGMTVGACCPTKCKKEFENKKKNNRGENKAKNDLERRVKRNENEQSRKKAEKQRKKNRKDTEWQNKRDLKEAKNKNEEGERKNKRGLTENVRKNEQSWKKNKEARRKAASKRETKRKEKRGKSAPAPTPPKACKNKKKNWARCARNKRCEKGQKRQGNSAPSC